MVQAVIFDVDGTLIDSVDVHAQAWQDIFLRYGVKTDFKAVRDQIGKGGDKLMKVFVPKGQIEQQGKEMEAERAKLFERKYLHQVKPFPRLKRLFERLSDDGIKIALASSAKKDELEVYKKITGIGPFLAKDTSSDDVSNSKPDPDIFRAAQQKLGIDPENIIAIGDTQYDAESAGKAGMATIGLLCGGGNRANLLAAGCIKLYRDPADLLKHYEVSPLVSWGRSSASVSDSGRPRAKKEIAKRQQRVLFLFGLGIGAAVGLLCAPRCGPETRAFVWNDR